MEYKNILAIDPGTTESGWVVYDPILKVPIVFGIAENADILEIIYEHQTCYLAIEMVASYGMAVGRTVFETCVWIGRFQQHYLGLWGVKVTKVYRKDVKMHLCGTTKAKDTNINCVLSDRYGGPYKVSKGTKKNPGPLYGMADHAWAALAVAITYAETGASNDKTI